jgi:hypothetical protein
LLKIAEFDGKGLNYLRKKVDFTDYIFVKKKHIKVLKIRLTECNKNPKSITNLSTINPGWVFLRKNILMVYWEIS